MQWEFISIHVCTDKYHSVSGKFRFIIINLWKKCTTMKKNIYHVLSLKMKLFHDKKTKDHGRKDTCKLMY